MGWRGSRLRILSISTEGLDVQIQCQLAPLSSDADMWKLCRFLGSMMRALRVLLGGLGWFIPGIISANHGRLRHNGWEKCCHGLTCWPWESSGEGFLGDLLGLWGFPTGSGVALEGTLKLRCHTFPLAFRKPSLEASYSWSCG